MTLILSEAAQSAPSQVGPILFFTIAAMVVLSAWAIVFSRNIVRMSVYLLLTLGASAGLYFALNAEFLAAAQLIVYAGGTLILIIFGIMLTGRSLFSRMEVRRWEQVASVALAAAIGLLLLTVTLRSTPRATQIAEGGGPQHVETIGRLLLSDYLVAFEVSAVMLLVVMIAAAYMARRRVD